MIGLAPAHPPSAVRVYMSAHLVGLSSSLSEGFFGPWLWGTHGKLERRPLRSLKGKLVDLFDAQDFL